MSVVLRTLGDDFIAWDKADNRRVYLSRDYALVLLSVPPTGIDVADLQAELGATNRDLAETLGALIDARLVISIVPEDPADA